MANALYVICLIILVYFATLWVGYLLFLVATFGAIIVKYNQYKYNNIYTKLDETPLIPMTVIIPAYNEENRILNAVKSILKSEYKNITLIVVNDGSTDTTLELLINTFDMVEILPSYRQKITTGKIHAYYQSTTAPNFILVDKEHSPFANSGADCINTGLNMCSTPVFMTVDSDAILEPLSFTSMLFTYLTTPHCVAIGGAIYVPDPKKMKDGEMLDTNIPLNPVLGTQVCEYLRSFAYGREGWTILGGSLCHPGGFTFFETKVVRDAGGFDSANYSYDAEIIMRLHHYMRKNNYPYTVANAPSAIAWCEQPGTVKGIYNQRSHWQRGLLRSLFKHLGMVLNPRYGITGMVGFPYYILFEIFGPVVEAISYIVFVLALIFIGVSPVVILWLLLLAWSYMLFITLSCVVLNLLTYNKYFRKRDIFYIVFFTILDMCFYRQVRAFCALFSSLHYFFNRLRGKPQ